MGITKGLRLYNAGDIKRKLTDDHSMLYIG